MEFIHFIVDFILHIDVHLAELVAQYGIWIYAILFLILFCETGLVVTPFLPGDSLLFVAGALAALPGNDLNVHLLVALLVVAAVLGDALNYTIGRLFGENFSATPTRAFSDAAISIKPTLFTSVTAEKPLSLRASFPLCAPLRPLWPGWDTCLIATLRCSTSAARWHGCCCSPMRVTCLATCRWCRRT